MLNNLKMLKQFQYFFHSRVPLGPLTPHKSWLIPGSVFFMTFSSPTRHRALFVLGETFRPLNETANKVDRNVYGSEDAERAKSSPGKKVQKPGEYWPQLINLKLKLLSRRDCLPINPHRTGFFAAIGNAKATIWVFGFYYFFPPFLRKILHRKRTMCNQSGATPRDLGNQDPHLLPPIFSVRSTLGWLCHLWVQAAAGLIFGTQISNSFGPESNWHLTRH